MLISEIFDHTPVLGLQEWFMQVQLFENTHPGIRKHLLNLYMKKSRDTFILEFIQCFSAVLAHPSMGGKKVDCVLKFVAVFFAMHETEVENVVHATLEFIFQHHNRESPYVRFNCCRFVTIFLNNLGESAALDERLFERIRVSMGKLLSDRNTRVRCEAVKALKRLQVPSDERCLVIKAYTFFLERDPNAEVRATILKNLVLSPTTLRYFIERISDVNGAVKIQAYKAFVGLNVKKLSIKYRQKILTYGLNDETDNVREYVTSQLIPNWFKSANDDFVALLKLLHIETLESDIVKRVLFSLFDDESTEELIEKVASLQVNKLIPVENISPENVTFWYSVINYLRQPKLEVDEDEIFKITPELTHFTVYIKRIHSKYVECLEKRSDGEDRAEAEKYGETLEFAMMTLFKISALYCMNDVVGREKLEDLCAGILTDKYMSMKCVPAVVLNLDKTARSTEGLHLLLAEIVNEIREPLRADESEMHDSEAKVSVQTNVGGRTDPETIIKCLTIILNVMKSKAIGKISETLLSLKDNFVMKCFEIENDLVQNLAQDVITLYCIWDEHIAKENILKFFFLLATEDTRISALKSLFDSLLAHGMDKFVGTFPLARSSSAGDILNEFGGPEWRNENTLHPEFKPLFTQLTNFLNSDDPEVRSLVSQGLAKLFLSGSLESPVVFAKLLAFWFSPLAAQGFDMRQPLGLFYDWFSKKSPNAGRIVLGSFLITIRLVEKFNEKKSDLVIDLMPVVNTMIDLVNPDVCIPPPASEKNGSYHMQLAFIIAKELVRVCNQGVLIRALNALIFPPEDSFRLKDLLELIPPIVKKVATCRDKRLLKILMSFKSRIAERMAQFNEETEHDIDSQISEIPSVSSRIPDKIVEEMEVDDIADPVPEATPRENRNNTVIDESFESQSSANESLEDNNQDKDKSSEESIVEESLSEVVQK